MMLRSYICTKIGDSRARLHRTRERRWALKPFTRSILNDRLGKSSERNFPAKRFFWKIVCHRAISWGRDLLLIATIIVRYELSLIEISDFAPFFSSTRVFETTSRSSFGIPDHLQENFLDFL